MYIYAQHIQTQTYTRNAYRIHRIVKGKENIPWYKMFFIYAVPYTPPAEPEQATSTRSSVVLKGKTDSESSKKNSNDTPLQMIVTNMQLNPSMPINMQQSPGMPMPMPMDGRQFAPNTSVSQQSSFQYTPMNTEAGQYPVYPQSFPTQTQTPMMYLNQQNMQYVMPAAPYNQGAYPTNYQPIYVSSRNFGSGEGETAAKV